MEDIKNINSNNEFFKSAKFLFAKPIHEGYYLYAIDDLTNLMMIDKSSLKQILHKLQCYNFIKINYIMDRNLPLFFDCKTKELKDMINETIEDSNIKEIILEELKNQDYEITNYERFFGEESGFFRNDISTLLNLGEQNYGNNKSISSRLSNRKLF